MYEYEQIYGNVEVAVHIKDSVTLMEPGCTKIPANEGIRQTYFGGKTICGKRAG